MRLRSISLLRRAAVAGVRPMSTRASLFYQSANVAASLRSTGSVGTNRDAEGSDAEFFGVDPSPTEVEVRSARGQRFTLDDNGFMLVEHVWRHIDYFDNASILNEYYGECERLVAEHTGASRVLAFDHNLRARQRKAQRQTLEAGGNAIQEPLITYGVHNDYTLESAPRRIEQLAQPLKVNDTLRGRTNAPPPLQPDQLERLLAGRWQFVNVWRNVSANAPVERHPLALCDAASVAPEDLVTFEIRYADRVGENYLARHAAAHRWYYFPRMTRDEAVLIKCWDSRGAHFFAPEDEARARAAATVPATFSLHTGFEDPATPEDAPYINNKMHRRISRPWS